MMTTRQLVDKLNDKEVLGLALALGLLDIDEIRDNIVYSEFGEEEINDALKAVLIEQADAS